MRILTLAALALGLAGAPVAGACGQAVPPARWGIEAFTGPDTPDMS